MCFVYHQKSNYDCKIFDDKDLKKWFEEGQQLNLRLLVEIRKRTTIYGKILQS